MELLLILSALLSALTGAAASGRVPEVRLHHAAASVAQAAVAATTAERRVVRHPIGAQPARIARSVPVDIDTVALPVIEPIYMARRRE